MKIRTLALAGLIIVLTGLIGLSIHGVLTWRSIDQRMAQLDRLGEYDQRVYQMISAIDYITLVRSEPSIISSLRIDALELAERLARIDHPQARLATAHLLEIGAMGEFLADVGSPTGSGDQHDQAMLLLSRQIRIHHAGAREALRLLVDEVNDNLMDTMAAGMRTLLLAAGIFALLVLVMVVMVHQRLTRPVRAIDDGLKAFSRGELDARIDLDRGDEFGDLARSFNQMVRQRRDYQQRLSERIKELRCLYRVLELTTDSDRPIDEVAVEIARLIPASLLHEELAVARVVLGSGEEHHSDNWQEPADTLQAHVSVDGEIIGLVEFGYCTSMKQAKGQTDPFLPEEQALIKGIAMHLGRMVKQRRLSESLARSERLKAVGELTGGIAHDFNNLLTVIMGNGELLQEQLAADKNQLDGLAAMIVTAAQRGADLTQRLLAFARRQALEPRVVDINKLLDDMRGLLVRSLGEDIDLRINLGADIWSAMVDPAQLESAVLNLCLNARDAMNGGGRLTVETDNVILDADYAASQEEVTPGRYVMLSISDTGCGMDTETVTRAFEPFFTTKDDGAGLGLSMVWGLIKQSFGHIRVYSEPGEGTTIRVYLPMARNQGDPVSESQPEHKALGGNETILVVEDNDLVRTYACTRLEACGYRILQATSGPEALTVIESNPGIDLLFTDVVMPGMSGKELADQAQQLRPGLKVLFTSGYTENAIVHHGRLDAGVNLLSKPYRGDDLQRRIRATLDQ